MIVGIGSDLCDVRRIEQTLERFGQRFIDRCFTEIEQRRSDARANSMLARLVQATSSTRQETPNSAEVNPRTGPRM